MRRSALLLVPALASCAYYNGLYNAREAEHRADALARAGRDAEAGALYATAAEKAETVLVRYPKSRWRTDALYLAGRGSALGGRCEQGLRRIEEFLAAPPSKSERRDRSRRDRARLSAGICLTSQDRAAEALATLEPLARTATPSIRHDAALWAARAATRLGDHDRAARFLAALGPGEAQWELVSASLRAGAYARAESLLALRASAGDLPDAASEAVRALWTAGRRDGAVSLVDRFGDSRAPAGARARLHLELGELALADDRAEVARRHLGAARRLTSDTLVERRAEALLTGLAVADAESMDGVARALSRPGAGRGTAEHQRLDDLATLVRLLSIRADPTGASLFLAGEVARDSLRAPAVARWLFARLPEAIPDSPLAPKALLAAAALWRDSADAFRGRVVEKYRATPYARIAAGDGVGEPVTADDDLLRATWAAAVTAWSDSLRRARPAATVAGAPPAPPGAP